MQVSLFRVVLPDGQQGFFASEYVGQNSPFPGSGTIVFDGPTDRSECKELLRRLAYLCGRSYQAAIDPAKEYDPVLLLCPHPDGWHADQFVHRQDEMRGSIDRYPQLQGVYDRACSIGARMAEDAIGV